MIHNNSNESDPHILEIRSNMRHRALWLYYFYDEVKKRGLDEKIVTDAIAACGHFQGKNNYPQSDDLADFVAYFTNETDAKVFEMKHTADDTTFKVEFHHCPLVDAWMRVTDDEALLGTLCDIAMAGDRAIIEEYPGWTFELGNTIAKGGMHCDLCVRKNSG